MSIVLPVATNNSLVGSAVAVAIHDRHVLLATTLHLFGESETIQIAVPPHTGDCSVRQDYPLPSVATVEASILASNPFADVAIVGMPQDNEPKLPLPRIPTSENAATVGAKVAVLGYPFAPLGSALETWTPGHVTALARRKVGPGLKIDELVISNMAHPGSSGSAVIGTDNGVLYGVVRGSLSPPEVIKIGNISAATDTTVTFATSAHLLHELIQSARTELDSK